MTYFPPKSFKHCALETLLFTDTKAKKPHNNNVWVLNCDCVMSINGALTGLHKGVVFSNRFTFHILHFSNHLVGKLPGTTTPRQGTYNSVCGHEKKRLSIIWILLCNEITTLLYLISFKKSHSGSYLNNAAILNYITMDLFILCIILLLFQIGCMLKEKIFIHTHCI